MLKFENGSPVPRPPPPPTHPPFLCHATLLVLRTWFYDPLIVGCLYMRACELLSTKVWFLSLSLSHPLTHHPPPHHLPLFLSLSHSHGLVWLMGYGWKNQISKRLSCYPHPPPLPRPWYEKIYITQEFYLTQADEVSREAGRAGGANPTYTVGRASPVHNLGRAGG